MPPSSAPSSPRSRISRPLRHSRSLSKSIIAAFPLPPSHPCGLGLGVRCSPEDKIYRSVIPFGRTCSAPVSVDVGGWETEGERGWWALRSGWDDDTDEEAGEGDEESSVDSDDDERVEEDEAESAFDISLSHTVAYTRSSSPSPQESEPEPARHNHLFSPRTTAQPKTPEEYAFLLDAIDFSEFPPLSPPGGAKQLRSSPMTRSSAVYSPPPNGNQQFRTAAPLSPSGASIFTSPSPLSIAALMARTASTAASSTSSSSRAASLFSVALSHASSVTSLASTASDCASETQSQDKPSVLARGRPVPTGSARAEVEAERIVRKTSNADSASLGLGFPTARRSLSATITVAGDQQRHVSTATIRPTPTPTPESPSVSHHSCSADVFETEAFEFTSPPLAGAFSVHSEETDVEIAMGMETRLGGRTFTAEQRDLLIGVWLAAEESQRERERETTALRGASGEAAGEAQGRARSGVGRKVRSWFGGKKGKHARGEMTKGDVGPEVPVDMFEPRDRMKRTRSIEQILFGPL